MGLARTLARRQILRTLGFAGFAGIVAFAAIVQFLTKVDLRNDLRSQQRTKRQIQTV